MTVDVAGPEIVGDDLDVGVAHYRYPGSPPFRDTELDRRLFRGRAQEADLVLHSILSANLFLLYAASGLGKTSLLNAGVMHELRARAQWPVSVRLNDPSRSPVEGIRERIEAAASSDPDVDLVIAPDAATGDDPETLWDLLAALEVWRGNELQQPVLILDQFEELFTLDWDDDVRSGFIEQFGEVVRGHRSDPTAATDTAPPDVRFVLVIREDSLGELDALAADVPQIMRNRFRLGALDPQQAEAAVLEPAQLDDARLATQRFEYTEAAAQEILEFLRTEKQRGSTRLATTVDPSQLQIVCQYVELAILPDKVAGPGPDEVAVIDAPDLGGREGLDRILSDFYRRTIESLPSAEQRAARKLCEDGLINRSGRRLSLEQDEIVEGYDVESTTLQALVDGRLLRADPRVGSVYYELSHDTLVGPIRAYRDEQRALQRRRRNRVIGIVAAVVAVIVIAVAIAIAAASGSSDSAVEPAIDLAVGDVDVAGAIEEPGDVVRYAVDADPTDPLVVVVEPEPGLNAVIDVTTLNEARVTRQVDQYAAGTERMVIPPVPEGDRGQEIRVTSFDSTLGSFAVSVETRDAVGLTSEADEASGLLTGPDSLGVFSVETSAEVVNTLTATPVMPPSSNQAGAQSGGAVEPSAAAAAASRGEQKSLDIQLEVIGPSGVGRRIDDAGAWGAESVTFAEPVGVYHVVVRGNDGATGEYTVELESSELSMGGALEIDESVRGVITAEESAAEFTFAPPADGQYSIVVVPDGQFDAVVETESADGERTGTDSGGSGAREVVLVPGAQGPFTVTVSGWEGSAGGFEISVQPVMASSVEVGDVQTGSAEGVFDVEVDEGELALFTVEPTGGGFADVVVTDSDGLAVSFAGSAGPGEAASAVIGGAAGTNSVVVSISGGDAGLGFSASLDALESQRLARGETADGVGPATFEVEVAEGEIFQFVVEPASESDIVQVEVRDPDGFTVGFVGSLDGSPAVTPVGGFGGTYSVVVAADRDAAYAATTEPIESQPLALGETVAATGTAALSVEVGEGEFYALATDVGPGNAFVEGDVRDPGGYFAAAVFAAGGEPPGLTGFGGRGGTYLVFVAADGGDEFTISLTEPQPLAPGERVAVEGDAVFQFDARDGEALELSVEPESADAYIEVELLGPDGFAFAFEATDEPGATLAPTAVAEIDGTHLAIVKSFEGDGGVVVSLATG